MTPLNELLQFFDVKESLDHQVLERHDDLMVIRCYDEIMELSCGSLGTEVDVITCDYVIYHSDNVAALKNFKKKCLATQAAILTKKKAELEGLIKPKKSSNKTQVRRVAADRNNKTALFSELYMNTNISSLIQEAVALAEQKHNSHLSDAMIYGKSVPQMICDEVEDVPYQRRKSKNMRPSPYPMPDIIEWGDLVRHFLD